MMNNIWNELSEESKKNILEEYGGLLTKNSLSLGSYTESLRIKDRIEYLESIFGKDNLHPNPQIKTWEDYLESIKDEQAQSLTGGLDKVSLDSGYVNRDFPVFKKAIATFKIAKLIEVAYGGMITDEEWKDHSIRKYYINVTEDGVLSMCYTVTSEENDRVGLPYINHRHLIAFHTEKQRDTFYHNNKQLCEDYFIV